MNSKVEELNRLPLGQFPEYFASLSPPDSNSLRGFFKGDFVGPAWLRGLAGPLLVITGLGGWWGKEFDAEGGALNLVWRNEKYSYRFPMRLTKQNSYIDRRSGLALRYASSNPFPWPWIVDELRSIQTGLVLGMTVATLGPLKRLPLPFILQPEEGPDGL
jgi:hypothetical protein